MAAGGWPYLVEMGVRDVAFAGDGRVVINELGLDNETMRVVTLLPDGAVAPGWPWQPASAEASIGDIALGPEGSVYVIGRAGPLPSPDEWKQALHRLDATGREMPGFPVTMPAVSSCGLAVDPNGDAVVACQVDPTTTSTPPETIVTVVRPDGGTAVGWPANVPGGASIAGFVAGGRIVLAVYGETTTHVAALDADGTPVSGWQQPGFGDLSDTTIDQAGRVRVVSHTSQGGECGAPIRTTYAVLGSDGRPAPGWPVSVAGWGSAPLVRADGSMVVATTTGSVLAFGLDGHRLGGWTSSVPVAVGCFAGSTPVAVGGAGQVVLSYDRATLVSARGAITSGWPIKVPGTVAINCPTCTPGPAAPVLPAADGSRIYIGAYGPSVGGVRGSPHVVVVDPRGRVVAQTVIGTPGDELAWLRVADGRVWALLTRDTGGVGGTATLVLVADSGSSGS